MKMAEQLFRVGRFAEAEKLCRSSIKLGRDVLIARTLLAECMYNRSVFLAQYPSFYTEVESLLREVISLNPGFSDALNNLGSLLLITSRLDEALDLFERVLRIQPFNINALENLALVQQEMDQYQQASVTLRKLASINPSNSAAYLIREALLMPAIPPSDDFILAARGAALEKLADLEAQESLSIADPLHFPSTYFRFAYHGLPNTDLNAAVARIYTKFCPALLWASPHVAKWQRPSARVRVGIASCFLRTHSVGSVMRGLFEMLDRERFEVIAIRLEPFGGDETSRAIDQRADKVVEIKQKSLNLARETIAKLELDILFYPDIGMEPFSYFLSLSRLAPIQMTWFGHPDTTGVSSIDYYVSAKLNEVSGAQSHYTEKLILLPKASSMSYYYRPSAPVEQLSRADFGLSQDQRVYCCPQQLFKIQPDMDRLFLGIVERDPDAFILLFESAEKHWRIALEKRMAAYSPLLKERVRFLPTLPYEHFLCLLQLSDVVLDTTHFNGYNTTLECFAMGIPVVTLPNQMQRGRFGYAFYRAIGFMDLVADSENRFVELACRVATDRSYRDFCCERIAAGSDVFFENAEFVRNFEDAIAGMIHSAASCSKDVYIIHSE